MFFRIPLFGPPTLIGGHVAEVSERRVLLGHVAAAEAGAAHGGGDLERRGALGRAGMVSSHIGTGFMGTWSSRETYL